MSHNVNSAGTCSIRRNYVVFLCCLLTGLSLDIAAETLFVERIDMEQGLSQNNVTSIVQDHKGFMWFGTQTALNRYDGYTFKKYKRDNDNPNSLSNGSTWALEVDSQGVLWAGTYSGLNRYNELSDDFTRFQHDPNNPKSLSHDNVWSLLEDARGNLWVGTGKGLNRLDRETNQFTRFLSNPDDSSSISNDMVNVIYQDSQENLWIGTDRGLNRFNYDAETFAWIEDASSQLRQAVVTSVIEAEDGRLWVGTDGSGIYIINQSGQVVANKKHNPNDNGSVTIDKIKVMIKDRHGRIWVGTDNGGLDRYESKNDRFVHYKRSSSDPNSLGENIIFSIYEDSTGVIWIGTYTQGISKINPYGFSLTLALDYATPEDPEPHVDIRGFLVDRQENLWVASSSNGIRVTAKDGNKVSYMHDPNDATSIGSNKVYAFYEDTQGVIWAGTANGFLNRFNAKEKNFTRYEIETLESDGVRHGKILAIDEDRQGRLWLSDERGGAHTFDRKTKRFTHYHHDPENSNSIGFNRVFDMLIDSQDIVWFATYGGLSKYDQSAKQFTTYQHVAGVETSISGNILSCLHFDENDEKIIWIGVAARGLDRFDVQTETFNHWGPKDGLGDDNVYGIVQEKNILWIAHNMGVSKFNITTQAFSNYEQQDGLQNNEFNGGAYYKAADGKLYLGGIAGYNAFYTDQIIDNPNKPTVHITEFQLFNKPVSIGEQYNGRVLLSKSIVNTDKLVLSYKDSVFSFEFAGLDYAFSAKNQYAYKMDGLEGDWNYVDSTRRYATYTTLPPGDYVFRVKASNNNGVWNEEGDSLAITITPPFWQTWWFRIISLVLVVMIVFTVYAYRMKAIKERNRILKEQVKEATAELEKEKSNLEETLVELGETKDALIEAAHKAGMADTATGVLHNVGNLLNSVNTSTGVMREKIETSVAKKFIKATELLVQNKDNLVDYITNDPKGKKILDYFMNLVQPFQSENEVMRENVFRLAEKVNAISETIAAQQRYAKGGAFVEELSLPDLVDDSISLQSGSINRHEIQIIKDYDETVPKIKLQKTKLVQIIINLYKNAKEAMDLCSGRENVLKISIEKDDEHAYIIFQDNGIGIDPDKVETIFAHGFTTKSEGHGFGLHSCANYMTEMGGKLWAESEGPDKGASFIMKFPIKGKGEHDPSAESVTRGLKKKVA